MNDPLSGNKIAAAILVALLLFFGLPILAETLMGGHESGGHGELDLAFPVAFETTDDASSGAEEQKPALAVLLADASAAAGERRSAICKSCHTLEKDGANLAGPNLWGIVDRQVADRAGYGYTAALQGFGGVWTYERLDGYLENSEAFVPGTAMRQRFAKPEQRADLLAYLQTLSDNPVGFPQPANSEPDTSAQRLETDEAVMAEPLFDDGEVEPTPSNDAADEPSDH